MDNLKGRHYASKAEKGMSRSSIRNSSASVVVEFVDLTYERCSRDSNGNIAIVIIDHFMSEMINDPFRE